MGGLEYMSINFFKQTDIFNPEEYQEKHIIILGVGSTGSFTAFILAKMGFSNIEVYDYDKVENHNIPNQYYKISDVGRYKVEALKDIIKEFSDVNINTHNEKIDENTNLNVGLNTIIINCFDSMEARKTAYNLIKDFPIRLIDSRFGGEGFIIYNIDLNNEEEKKLYEESLNLKPLNTPCGQKGIIYSINALASEITNIIKRECKKEQTIITLRRDMKSYRFLYKMKGGFSDNGV